MRVSMRAAALGAGLALLTQGCIIVDESDDDVAYMRVACWAVGVADYSSNSLPNSEDYSPTQATGIPDTQNWNDPTCVDSPLAWSPADENAGSEWIDLLYAAPLWVDFVDIYENFGPGASHTVTLINTRTSGVPDYVRQVPSDLQGSNQPCGVLELDVDAADGGEYTLDRYDKVLIDLDTAQSPGYNEIDAVRLIGEMREDESIPASCELL